MNEEAACRCESYENRIKFVKRMGLKVKEVKRGYIKLHAPLVGNENHIGIMYAGALFSLAEFLGGVFCWSSFDESRFFPIVKNVMITYLRPVKTDAHVEVSLPDEEIRRIEKEAENNGKSDFKLETSIKNDAGEMVATTVGIYQLRAGRL